jgi:glycosyltransferase involved in cell wall biosynthesis
MRILHLAYEDPLQPVSGGGSVRVREINHRLAERHEITNLVAAYPGAEPRVEDGVRWVPIGARTRKKIAQLSYFALLGLEVARRPHDLVVEEFGAPFSTGFSPLFTKQPVVASVQWLFASQMRAKYWLPFDEVEKRGLRFYDRFIAVSGWLADELRTRRPGVVVETIPNGVEKMEYEARATVRHLLFVGRLDLTEKGGDLLFEIFVRVHRLRGKRTPQLVIVGDGPDRKAMERLAQKSGLSHLVEFRGRVEGVEKYRLMSGAHAVLMPSRYETFGLVGIESLAAGAPLIAFDVGPLREVVGDSAGARLIRPWDLDAFAQEVLRFVDDRELRERVRKTGRHWARRYDWDEISLRQEEFYLRTLRERQNLEPAANSPKRSASSIRKQPWRQLLSGSSWQLGYSSCLSSGEATLAGASRLIGRSAASCSNLTLLSSTKQRGPRDRSWSGTL